MSDDEEAIRDLVRIVSAGLRRHRSEREIADDLMATGVPAADATKIAFDVKKGIQAGVQAAFTGGLSATEGPPADPLLAAAFRFGHDEFRRTVRRIWIQRLAAPVGVLLLLIAAVAGRFFHWW
jgi:hypothetical protein